MTVLTIASELRAIREALGLSQSEFATALCLGDPAGNGKRCIRNWESGDVEPSGPAIQAIRFLYAIYSAAGRLDPESPDPLGAFEILHTAMPEALR